MKTLYLSGDISHNPNYRQAFETAHKALTEAGYTVISPLYICHDDCLKNRVKWFFRFITFYRFRRSEFLYNLKVKLYFVWKQ